MQHAAKATSIKESDTNPYVTRSRGLTAKRRADTNRVKINAEISPIAMPINVNFVP